MLVPFLLVAFILTTKRTGYCSFLKGFVFSVAYYLPAQYRAVWITFKHPDDPFLGGFVERLGVTVLGALMLSGIYYLFVTWQRRMREKCGT
jgi:hypothetical protein